MAFKIRNRLNQMTPVQLLIGGEVKEVRVEPKKFSRAFSDAMLTPYAKTLARKRFIEIITVPDEELADTPPAPAPPKNATKKKTESKKADPVPDPESDKNEKPKPKSRPTPAKKAAADSKAQSGRKPRRRRSKN